MDITLKVLRPTGCLCDPAIFVPQTGLSALRSDLSQPFSFYIILLLSKPVTLQLPRIPTETGNYTCDCGREYSENTVAISDYGHSKHKLQQPVPQANVGYNCQHDAPIVSIGNSIRSSNVSARFAHQKPVLQPIPPRNPRVQDSPPDQH